MAEYRLPYGKTELVATLPDDRRVELLAPVEVAGAADPAQVVYAALDAPVGGARLDSWAGARSVAIAISDKTRPIPLAALYPLLNRLGALGFRPDTITFLIATGTHAPMPPGEFDRVLPPDILAQHRVISHNCDDADTLVYLGDTMRGTPVWASRYWMEAGLRIVVGNIEPHQFMGFSGGAKSAAIGLAGRMTINRNHAMMRDPEAALGRYETNPVRQDVEEIGQLMGVHFALNTILNRHKQIVWALAGEPVAVMQAGMPLLRQLYQVQVAAPFDLVIASPGGHPKDINLYQAQKALGHASLITREGGTVIITAACPEGSGSASHEKWMEGMTSYQAVLERFGREEFRLGPHKAFQIARDASRMRVLLVSEMPPELIRRLLLNPARSLGEALDLALRDLAPAGRIGIMPMANATLPVSG